MNKSINPGSPTFALEEPRGRVESRRLSGYSEGSECGMWVLKLKSEWSLRLFACEERKREREMEVRLNCGGML